jgi:hypothetical protein
VNSKWSRTIQEASDGAFAHGERQEVVVIERDSEEAVNEAEATLEKAVNLDKRTVGEYFMGFVVDVRGK